MIYLTLPHVKGENGSAASPVGDFQILKDHCLLPYLPKQSN